MIVTVVGWDHDQHQVSSEADIVKLSQSVSLPADIDLLEVTRPGQSSQSATLLCWKHLEHLLVEGRDGRWLILMDAHQADLS